MMDYLEKIREAGAKHKAGTLEAGACSLLVEMGKENPAWAEIIAQDLDVKEMNLSALAKALTDYARKHQVRGSFVMSAEKAREIIADFYKLPAPEADRTPETAAESAVDLMDLL